MTRRYRVVKPFELRGRVVVTHEAVRLDERIAAPLIESGHIVLIAVLFDNDWPPAPLVMR